MANTYYYPKTLESVIVSLSSLFNNIEVHLFTTSGSDSGQKQVVNIGFGPVDSAYIRRKADLNENGDTKKYYQQFPKIGIVLKNIVFDKTRAIGSNDTMYYLPNNSAVSVTDFISQLQPTPYNFEFELQCRTLFTQDMIQIVEQILPFFNPQTSVRVKEFSFLNLERDLKIILDEWPLEFEDILEEDERRVIKSNVNIIVEGFLYRPFSSNDAKVIKKIDARFWVNQFNPLSVPASDFSVSGTTTTYSALSEEYMLSGVPGYNVSAFPHSYETSAYNPIKDMYYFTSAANFE